MATRTRGELITPTDVVNLTAKFYDQNGNLANTDSFPTISIIDPSGLVIFPPTSMGVQNIATGIYVFSFTAPFDGPLGVWMDIWQGNMSGITTTQTLNFIIQFTQLPNIDTDGYAHLGSDVGFFYSQIEIKNINKLLKTLKARLNSSGLSKSTDVFGNVQYVSCDIFTTDQLVTFIANSLTFFNQIPYFTFFTFNDNFFVDQFHNILVDRAVLDCLASQALIERGREFNLSDNGVTFQPPSISELLNSEYTTMLANVTDQIKYIKNSLRPSPLGLGSLRLASNPYFARLRTLRARQLI